MQIRVSGYERGRRGIKRRRDSGPLSERRRGWVFVWAIRVVQCCIWYDALYNQEEVKHNPCAPCTQQQPMLRHGYCRATGGKPGVGFLVTSRPGATNAVTGIATLIWIPFNVVLPGHGRATAYQVVMLIRSGFSWLLRVHALNITF